MGQSVYMAGILVGFFFWGLLSHRFGRKPMLSWCCLQVAVASTGTVFSPNFFIYCSLRFLSAFGLAGIILTLSTLMVEWTTTHKRAVSMTILGCTFSTGQMALAGLAFALRDWRDLQLAVSVPFFAISLISWWLPESARWLIIRGKPEQALQELKKVAKINGHKEAKKTLTIEVLMSSMEEEMASAEDHGSVLDLFRVPMLRWRTCAMLMVNFSLLFSYYGLVLDLQSLGRDIFLLQALFGAVDFLGRATTILSLRFFGRRITLAGSQALAGVSILANMLVPQAALGVPLVQTHCPLPLRRPADPARGLRCAGERMLWDEPDLPHRLQDGALPNPAADDRGWLPAVGRPPGSYGGPTGQDGPPGAAPAAPDLLRRHPHRVQPASVLSPGDPGTAPPRHHPGPGESGISCGQGRPARSGHSRKHLALEICRVEPFGKKTFGDRVASSPIRGWKPGGLAQPGCLGQLHGRRGSSPFPATPTLHTPTQPPRLETGFHPHPHHLQSPHL
ncbi:solute carrier family 22 member 11 isoform X3 [Marmota marmota marmota]|nr:solute carrier family 22 member 11 isoform X3 [Marmota marmota marmota]XP_048645045.1 solute carrier family 22 member 11 isoform X3 [Marmota marmota marmota]